MQTLERNRYAEIIMTRVTIPLGEDIGFLPGTEEEKMEPWMGALMDNLEVLTRSEEGGNWGRAATNDLLRNRIKIRSMNYMRGRTFLNRYIILDEAQNLTPKQMKALITRAGPGSKLVALGQHRADRHALPDRDHLGPDLRRQSLPRLGARRPRDAAARRALAPGRLRFRAAVGLVGTSAADAWSKCGCPPQPASACPCARRSAPRRGPAAWRWPRTPTSDTAVSSELPDMGSPENAMLSRSDEFQIGLMAMHQLRGQGLILDDPELTDYIQQLGSRLAAQARDDDQNFQYFILRSTEINAFATFGGFICVNSGLILLTETESDLAGVLAHETAHVRQRHIARSIVAQSRMSLATTAAMLAAVLLGAASGAGGQAMEGAIAMSQGVALQQSMNFTRSEEAEADRIGIGLLAGAGFNAMAMANFFESMGRRDGLDETRRAARHAAQPPGHARSHRRGARRAPRSTPRIRSTNRSCTQWMRERLRVLVAPTDKDMTVYYAQMRERRPLSDAGALWRGAGADARRQAGRGGRHACASWSDKYPQITALYAALGQALQADHQSDEALATFARAMALFPRNVPLAVRYADTLMQTGHARQAHLLLLDVFNNTQPTPGADPADGAGRQRRRRYRRCLVLHGRVPHQPGRPGARQPAARTGPGLAQPHLGAAPALPRPARRDPRVDARAAARVAQQLPVKPAGLRACRMPA